MKRLFGAVALAAVSAVSAYSQPLSTGPAPVLIPPAATAAPQPLAQTGSHELTREDVSAWLDGLVPTQLKRTGVAGAEVVVVRDGQVIFSKGYGYADVANRTPVDPATTLFRPGSISKLFTWTAVMQLEEQGKLDLNKDVNAYIDFKIPEAFGKPITIKNLMTHTPGFEEVIKNLMTTDPKAKRALGDVLKQSLPVRIFPPGEVPAYSNYGAALAGYIVQRVSGEPFEQYIQHHIFDPLGMKHATFEQPLQKALAADMSQGYDKASGDPKQFEIIDASPAGGLSAAGDDIARFMLAHLNNGSYGGVEILKPETAKLMHSMALQLLPGVPGMAYGFYHEDRNGHDVIGHGGDTQWFHSDLHLIMDKNVGLYISMNSAGTPDSVPVTSTRRELYEGFMDRYFPQAEQPTPPAIKSAKEDAQKVAGLYDISRKSLTNFMNLSDLGGQVAVAANDDNTISIPLFLDSAGKPKKFRETAPNHWQEVNGKNDVEVAMKDGKVAYILSNEFPQILTVMPVSAWDSMYWRLPLFGFAIVMLLLTALFWPIKAVLRRRYGQRFELQGREATLYRGTRIVALIDTLFIAGWAIYLTMGSTNLELLSNNYDWLVRLLQLIGLIGIVGIVVVVLNFMAALGNPARRWWTKITDGLLVVSALALVWFTLGYHLISLGLNY